MKAVQFLASFLVLSILRSSASGDVKSDWNCVYTVYVRTGSIIKAGTDSKISLTLGDSTGRTFTVLDLENWGLMGSGYDYYERGNLDVFSGRAPCLTPPLCYLNLTSDGTRPHHGWYCEYAEVTSTGPHIGCSQSIFYVRQWLATDAPPYQLSAVINGCDQPESIKKGKGAFVYEKNLRDSQ